MKNIRKYNNNVILADDGGHEVIVLGRGLGFNALPGAPVDSSLVEKVFVPQETSQMSRFQDILGELPYEQLILASKIVDFGKTRLGCVLNQSIIIALADHLSFVLKRLHDRLDIEMPLAWDIQHIYPAEFAVGEEAINIIEKETKLRFPHAEAASIALHFINAETDAADMPATMAAMGGIKKIVALIESFYNTVFDETSYDFAGLVTLLHNTVMRFTTGGAGAEKQLDDDMELYDLLRKRYAQALVCAEKAADLAEKEQGWHLTRNDVSFLALHISRVTGGM
jgi:beta-glucoside operon transcriptional antiterminator